MRRGNEGVGEGWDGGKKVLCQLPGCLCLLLFLEGVRGEGGGAGLSLSWSSPTLCFAFSNDGFFYVSE